MALNQPTLEMPKITDPEELTGTTLIAGHVPKPTVEFLDEHLVRSWRNRTIKAYCACLEIVLRDSSRDTYDKIIERSLLAMAHNDETYQQIWDYLHDD